MFVAVVGLVCVLVTGCGHTSPSSARDACTQVHLAVQHSPSLATPAGRMTTAQQAQAAFTTLASQLGQFPSDPTQPEASANLRYAAGVLAIAYRDLGELLVQPGSGLLHPLITEAGVAYAQLDTAARQLNLPECRASQLGNAIFAQLAAHTDAPAGTDLHIAATVACTTITHAYGTNVVAIDAPAALTELNRSRAVLHVALAQLGQLRSGAGATLRQALTGADTDLANAATQISAGAPAALTSLGAFTHADAAITTGFRQAGVVCLVPTP